MDCKVIIIGSGVIGLAIARSLSKFYSDVYVIEKNTNFGMEISSRNSEVIHSGIYYPPESLKADLCVKGRHSLYEYCKLKRIKNKKIGKLIIGQNKLDYEKLIRIKKNAEKNGVSSILLDKKKIKEIEPNLEAQFALHFSESGIVDSHNLMNSLKNDSISQNVDFVFKNEVENIEKLKKGYLLTILDDSNNKYKITSSIVINAGGLYSSVIARMIGINDPSYTISFWKGDYFWVNKKEEIELNSLIYPLPSKNISGLGIHSTLDMNGRMKFGPDAEYLGEKIKFNYSNDDAKRKIFYDSIKVYLPKIKLEDLQPDQSGIRPKLQRPNEPFRDFIISNEFKKGFPNFINLIGIESPGLTASLAIGDYVKNLITD